MSADEDTELRDMVAQTLETNGVLDKIRAELRASVFLALEEQDSLKSGNMMNQKLKDFLCTADGSLVASLVRDFLICFNLDFTLAVYDPESNHTGMFESREDLIKKLQIKPESKGDPLILEMLRRNQQQQTDPLKGQQKAKIKDEENSNHSPRSPSKIPQRVGIEAKARSEILSGNEKIDRSLEMNSAPEGDMNAKHGIGQRLNASNSFDKEDSELLAELGLSKDTNKKASKMGGWTDFDNKQRNKANEGHVGLGSLKDAPPLPGLGSNKNETTSDLNSSGDWKDLAAIEEKINKLGFDIPKEDDYGYEDDFLPSSSRKSEEGLSITEEIEEDISIGSFAGSKGDDYYTTDQTVSQISAAGFDYREDIDV